MNQNIPHATHLFPFHFWILGPLKRWNALGRFPDNLEIPDHGGLDEFAFQKPFLSDTLCKLFDIPDRIQNMAKINQVLCS